ncbi:MAG: hypothetical protein AAF483_01255 [Planctomycetota bacterium]
MESDLSNELQAEIQELVDAMLDNKLSDRQRSRLNNVLEQNDATAFYLEYSALHAGLAWQHRGSELALPLEQGVSLGLKTKPHLSQKSKPAQNEKKTTEKDSESTRQRNLIAFAFSLTLLAMVALGLAIVPPEKEKKKKSSPSDTIGQSLPINSQRLTGNTLTEIGRTTNLRWKFDDSTVEISFQNGPIPTAVVEDLLGPGTKASTISASWELQEKNQTLHLENFLVDGEPVDHETNLDIKPAGPIRIDLGSQQYNTYPNGIVSN